MNSTKVETFDDVHSKSLGDLSASIFNLKYQNCQRGMYSLRVPVKDTIIQKIEQPHFPVTRSHINLGHPAYLGNQYYSNVLEQDTFVSNDEINRFQDHHSISSTFQYDPKPVYPKETLENYNYDDGSSSPRYRLGFRLKPVYQSQVCPFWNAETPRSRTISLNQPRMNREPPDVRIRPSRLVNIETLYDCDTPNMVHSNCHYERSHNHHCHQQRHIRTNCIKNYSSSILH